MEAEKQTYQNIVEELLIECHGTYEGKMMSSPGVKFNNKVMVFYYKSAMVFRLGTDFDPNNYSLKTASLLSPFKNKPPLKGWFVIQHEEAEKWKKLAYWVSMEAKRLKICFKSCGITRSL